MGTNSEKHARQKEHRDRLAVAQHQVHAAARRRRLLTIAGAVLAIVIVIGAIVVLTGGDDQEAADGTSTTLTDASSTSVPAGGPADLPAPPAGATLTAATECPPADGSAERVQVFSGPPPMCIDTAASYTATFQTSLGDVTATLDAEAAPNTVNNFVVLSRYHYYDGVPFHRVVPGFVIQAGDGDGEPWGNNDLGYEIGDELPSDATAYTDYSLAMANAGPDTNGSQFFVVLPGGGAQLQALYSSFGQVTEGQDVVDAIGALGGAGDPQGRPSEAVLIESITITETAG
ncbi:MAG: peptidylprolyl isomerase [Microthrixaceae bacterium]